MPITKEFKRLEKSNVQLNITVPKDDIKTRYDDMIKEYTKNMQLPGFRKGKVPREVLERKYSEALKSDAMSRIMEAAFQEIFTDENLGRNEKPLPYSTPELQGEPSLDFEQDLVFSVIYDVLPEVIIGQWKGLTVEYQYAEIGKNDIDRELEEIRERNAIVMDMDDGACARKGDVVTIDYVIYKEDDTTPSDLERKDFVFTLGGGTNIYKFDDNIVGMKKGETRDFHKKFEDDVPGIELAGKTRKMQITLTSLKEKKLPEIDDDLAQDVDEKYKTLDDLKNSIKERLERNLDSRLREKKLNELLKKIMENTPVTLPESMIKAEFEGRMRRLARYYNIDPEKFKQLVQLNEKEQEWRDEAVKALHSRLIIETLIEEQKIEATEDELQKEFESAAADEGTDIEEIKKQFDDQSMFHMKEDIKEKKITDLLLEENSFKPGKKENYLDFMSDNG